MNAKDSIELKEERLKDECADITVIVRQNVDEEDDNGTEKEWNKEDWKLIGGRRQELKRRRRKKSTEEETNRRRRKKRRSRMKMSRRG